MNCPFTKDAGAYVLGSLSPAERLEFERQLPDCEECTRAVRDLAGIPGLLGRVEPSVLEQPADRPVPDTLLPTLSRQVRGARRRRLVIAAGVAAAIAVLVPVGVSQLGADDPEQGATTGNTAEQSAATAESMYPVGKVPVQAELSMEAVTWGTRFGLTCTYDRDALGGRRLPPAVPYTLHVRTRDGHSERVGSWRAVTGMAMQITAATSTQREDISWVQVRDPHGNVVLRLHG
jgi:anti-sigma-K factor RskA